MKLATRLAKLASPDNNTNPPTSKKMVLSNTKKLEKIASVRCRGRTNWHMLENLESGHFVDCSSSNGQIVHEQQHS